MEILDIVMISMTIYTIWFWIYHWNKPVESSLELFWCVVCAAISTLVPFVLIYYLVMILRVITGS